MKEKRKDIVEWLEGTSRSESAAVEFFELEFDEAGVIEIMLDAGYERCGGCDVWVEASELADADGEVVDCEECRGR